MTPAILYAYLLEMERKKREEELMKKRELVLDNRDKGYEFQGKLRGQYVPYRNLFDEVIRQNNFDQTEMPMIGPRQLLNDPVRSFPQRENIDHRVPGYMQNYLTPTTGIRG